MAETTGMAMAKDMAEAMDMDRYVWYARAIK